MRGDEIRLGVGRPREATPEPSSGIDLMAGQRTAYAFSKDFQLWLVCSYLCGFPFPLES